MSRQRKVRGGSDSVLPPIREVAEGLQNGDVFATVCQWYDISEKTLTNRLSYAGYGVDGEPLHKAGPRPSVLASAEGNCVTGNGGGDYKGLPIEPVLHSRRVRRVFIGLDWTTSPASGPRWYES